jgi:hypothetical protein
VARRTINYVFDKAQQALAAAAEEELLAAFRERYKKPGRFLGAVREFNACRYWQDAGYRNIAEYASAVLPHARHDEWMGWVALAKIDPPAPIVEMVRTGRLRLERLAPLRQVMNAGNYRAWLFMALYMEGWHLRQAVIQYRKLARTGYLGEAIFVPVWMPIQEYEEVFHDDKGDSPALETLKQGLAGRSGS